MNFYVLRLCNTGLNVVAVMQMHRINAPLTGIGSTHTCSELNPQLNSHSVQEGMEPRELATLSFDPNVFLYALRICCICRGELFVSRVIHVTMLLSLPRGQVPDGQGF